MWHPIGVGAGALPLGDGFGGVPAGDPDAERRCKPKGLGLSASPMAGRFDASGTGPA